ncbi:MAG: hypothetical protein COA99_13430 [Moraxellaceae bacterium]|nr:MAG: hypothetical protein COA99_13430 [Moraxellaceae bacterium]
MIKYKKEDIASLQIKFTESPSDLEAYYQLVETVYKRDLNVDLSEYRIGSSDNTYCLVAKHKGTVVGGLLGVVISPESENLLPLESDTFRLRDVLPEYCQGVRKYAELTRIVVDPCFRIGDHIVYELLSMFVELAVRKNIDTYFSLSPLTLCRTYRRVGRRLGVEIVPRTDINYPAKSPYKENDVTLFINACRMTRNTNNQAEGGNESQIMYEELVI